MILEGLERMAGGCIRIMKESCFFKRFSHLPPDYERATRQKVSWQKTLASRRRVLLWHENNRWRNLGRAIFRWFLQGSLGSVGVSFLLMGAFSLAGCWIWGRPSLLSARFLSSAVLFLCAVPLLGSRESCGYGIRKGRLFGGFLLGFCKLPEIGEETVGVVSAFGGDRRTGCDFISPCLCFARFGRSHPFRVAFICSRACASLCACGASVLQFDNPSNGRFVPRTRVLRRCVARKGNQRKAPNRIWSG